MILHLDLLSTVNNDLKLSGIYLHINRPHQILPNIRRILSWALGVVPPPYYTYKWRQYDLWPLQPEEFINRDKSIVVFSGTNVPNLYKISVKYYINGDPVLYEEYFYM